ncbi:MAG: cation transporter [Cyanobacteria bacterium SZAS LIN-2]|nr:cation transporter [Cyanobacteria bacterium SZAS LIN-2]
MKSARLAELVKVRGILITVFCINVVLSILKLAAGIYTSTLSLIAEGFHSLLDSSANAVAILGLAISIKPADDGHPYGHRKFEAISAIAISFFMFLASFEVVQQIIERVTDSGRHVAIATPLSFAVVIINMVANFAISSWEAKRGKELSSRLLIADSKHTLSDLWATLAVLISLISIALNYHFVDLIASVFIVGIILFAGFEVIMSHLGPLVDSAVVNAADVEKEVLAVPGVVSCHKIRSRGMEDNVFIDLHVQVPRALTIEEAHNISFAVESRLKDWDNRIFEVLVHLEDDSPPRPLAAGMQEGH